MKELTHWKIKNEKELDEMVWQLEKQLPAERAIILLDGEMGSGKSTLFRHYARAVWNIQGHLTSPTFSLVNTYRAKDKILTHFDLYRIEDPSELLEIGFSEYLKDSYRCFIEWPEPALAYLDEQIQTFVLHLSIENGIRNIQLTAVQRAN